MEQEENLDGIDQHEEEEDAEEHDDVAELERSDEGISSTEQIEEPETQEDDEQIGDEEMVDNDGEEEEEGEEEYDDEEDEEEGEEQDCELEEGEDLQDDEDDIEDIEEDGEDDEDDDEEEWEAVNEETERCPVCLDSFFDKQVGTPESCDHVFCLECILEWSRNVNTCPVDRSLYRSILVRHSYHGEVVRRIEVDERKTTDDQDEEPATYCEVCGRCDREDRLLLCDGCDSGYHCECLDPPLEHVPVEEWYCPECIAQNRHQEEVSSDEEGEVIERHSRPTHRHVTRERPAVRAIARTHVSERVRARITLARAERQQEQPRGTGSRTSMTRKKPFRKKATKKRKTVRRKGTKKRRKVASKTTTTATGKKVVKKRRVKRRKKRKSKVAGRVTKIAGPKSIRGRIAGKLMLVKPRTGSMMPDIKVKGHQTLDFRRNEIGAATLLLTGSDVLLDHASDTAISKTDIPSTSTQTSKFVSSSSTTDLLGNIFQGQDMLIMASKEITINRDGSLTKIPKDSQDRSSSGLRRHSFDQTKGKDSDETKTKSQSSTSSPHLHEDEPQKNISFAEEKDRDIRRSCEKKPSKQHLQPSDAEKEIEHGSRPESSRHHPSNRVHLKEYLDCQSKDIDGDDSDRDVFDDNDVAGIEEDEEDVEEEREEGMDEEEMDEEEEQFSDGDKVSGKNEESITCQASSSSFEESEEESVYIEKKSSSRRSKEKSYNEEEEGLIDDDRDNSTRSIRYQSHGKTQKVHRNDVDGGARGSHRKFSLEEGLIVEEVNHKKAVKRQRRNSLSQEEGLIEDGQDYKMHSERKRRVSHSDEEGLIADEEDMTNVKEGDAKKHAGTSKDAGVHHGHSSAEEGEVKTDDEDGSSSTRKKRKKERRRQRSRKDTRMVVIDSDISVTIPKRPLVEIQQGIKKTSEARSSDSATSRDRDFERGESQRGDHSVFGDLRHVIQVKRDVPYKRPSRYDAYWSELERQRKMEDEIAEKAAAWDGNGIYERPYPYEDDWGRMVLDHHPPERHWENFTIHRERSPVDAWRKSSSMERRVEEERRIEEERQMEHERFEAERKAELQRKMEAECRLADRKVDGRKDQELKTEHRLDAPRNGSRKLESVKGRSDHKKDVDAVKQRQKSDIDNKRSSSHKGDADRRQKSNHGSENDKRKHEDGKRDSRHKVEAAHSEKDRRRHQRDKERDKTETGKDQNKQREALRSGPHTRSTSRSKSSSNKDKDRHSDKQSSQTKQKKDTDSARNKQGKESRIKSHSTLHGKERSTSHDIEHSHGQERVSHRHERSVSSTGHHGDKHDHHQRQERSTSRQHERSVKQAHDHTSRLQEHVHSQHTASAKPEKHRQQSDKSKTKVQVSSKVKEKAHGKDRSKNQETEKKKQQNDLLQASSTSDQVASVPTKTKKRIRVRSPSTSQTGDEVESTEPTTQRPITVPATEMVVSKPLVEKTKKKKKDKTKKLKNKTNEDGKVKKTKKSKAGKTKKQKVVAKEIPQIEEVISEEKAEEEESIQEEEHEQVEEALPESGENKRPASSPISEEPTKKARTEEETEDQEKQEAKETEENQQLEEKKDLDSSSDVEVVEGPVGGVYDEIIDLSQISDNESLTITFDKPKAKESTLYDPFEPTASPETISSPDISERYTPDKYHKSRGRSRSQQRRTVRSPVQRGSSPRRRVSPRRQRSFSPRRKSPVRQAGSSKDRGYSTRKRSDSPQKRSVQKRRSPSPKRNVAIRKSTYSPRSPSRSQRRQSPKRHASPKRDVSPRKRSISPRRKHVSERRRAESPRRRSVSPRNASVKKRKASPRKSISPRRRNVSPRRRSRSPKKRSISPRRQRERVSPRRQPISQKRHSSSPRKKSAPRGKSASPRRRDISPRRRSTSPRKQIRSSRRASVSPKRMSVSPQRRVVSPKRASSPRRSISSRSYLSSSRSSRSLSSSSSWSSSSSGSWSSKSYSRSPSLSSRSPSPRGRRYSSRDRSSSSGRSGSSFSSERSSSSFRGTSPRRRSPSPERSHQVLRRSPTQTSPSYRRHVDSERSSPIPAPQPLPDSTQGSYKVVSTSPRSPNQTMAPATSTTDTHLSSSASSQISHILGQLASNPAIQSALNSANLSIQKGLDDTSSSTGSISGFLKSSEASFTSPAGREAKTRGEMDDKDLLSLDDVNEDNIESSAVDLYNKNSRDRYLKKLQHQERVVEEVKLALKPYYQKREVSKDDYKEILRKSVNQVCHSKSGEINPVKIKKLIEGYIKKFKCKKKGDDKKDTRPDLTFRLLTKS